MATGFSAFPSRKKLGGYLSLYCEEAIPQVFSTFTPVAFALMLHLSCEVYGWKEKKKKEAQADESFLGGCLESFGLLMSVVMVLPYWVMRNEPEEVWISPIAWIIDGLPEMVV